MHACIREQQSVSLTGVCVGDLFLLSYVDCIDILSLPPFNNKLTRGSHDDTPTHTDMEQSESPNICPQALSNHYPHHGFTPSCFVCDSPFSLEQQGGGGVGGDLTPGLSPADMRRQQLQDHNAMLHCSFDSAFSSPKFILPAGNRLSTKH